MNIKRFIQFITNIHRIHSVEWGYGYIFKPIPIGYFDGYNIKENHPDYWALKNVKGFHKIKHCHDCTITGVY